MVASTATGRFGRSWPDSCRAARPRGVRPRSGTTALRARVLQTGTFVTVTWPTSFRSVLLTVCWLAVPGPAGRPARAHPCGASGQPEALQVDGPARCHAGISRHSVTQRGWTGVGPCTEPLGPGPIMPTEQLTISTETPPASRSSPPPVPAPPNLGPARPVPVAAKAMAAAGAAKAMAAGPAVRTRSPRSARTGASASSTPTARPFGPPSPLTTAAANHPASDPKGPNGDS